MTRTRLALLLAALALWGLWSAGTVDHTGEWYRGARRVATDEDARKVAA